MKFIAYEHKHTTPCRCCITRDFQLRSNQEKPSLLCFPHCVCVCVNANEQPPLCTLPPPLSGCTPTSPHCNFPPPIQTLVFRIQSPICSTSPYLIVQNDTFTFYGEPIILSYTVRWLCEPTCPDQLRERGGGPPLLLLLVGCSERKGEWEKKLKRRK